MANATGGRVTRMALAAGQSVIRVTLGYRRVRLGFVNVDGFIRDGYVVIRGAVDAATVADCRERIWESMAGRGIRRDDPATWPPLVHIDDLSDGRSPPPGWRRDWPRPATN
jgi:hypothetical protein